LVGIHWGVLIIIISIIIDISRVKVLKKAAKEHGSQALEADALHFSSDVWSSSVVIVGLICVWIGNYFNIAVLKYADPVAALGVALLVINVSLKLGRKTIDDLLDTAPKGMKELIENEISNVTGIIEVADIRIRPSGAMQYIDVNIGIDPNLSHRTVHTIVHQIRERILAKVQRCDIVVSTYPVDTAEVEDSGIDDTLEKVISQIPECLNVHNIRVYQLEGRRRITAHVEVKDNLTLKESHDLSHKISKMVQEEIKDIDNVSIFFECAEQAVKTEDVTEKQQEIVNGIKNAVNKIKDNVDCHDINLYRNEHDVSVFLHCGVRGDFTIDRLETISTSIKNELRNSVSDLENVHIHFEPLENAVHN
jgi:divalent metal cation (Fe/Co/Zn/Cd) transporter